MRRWATHGLEDGQSHAAEHSRLDRGARNLAVALGCVAIAAGEEGAGDGDGEEGGAADAEVAVVHVAALRSKPPGVNARQFNS